MNLLNKKIKIKIFNIKHSSIVKFVIANFWLFIIFIILFVMMLLSYRFSGETNFISNVLLSISSGFLASFVVLIIDRYNSKSIIRNRNKESALENAHFVLEKMIHYFAYIESVNINQSFDLVNKPFEKIYYDFHVHGGWGIDGFKDLKQQEKYREMRKDICSTHGMIYDMKTLKEFVTINKNKIEIMDTILCEELAKYTDERLKKRNSLI